MRIVLASKPSIDFRYWSISAGKLVALHTTVDIVFEVARAPMKVLISSRDIKPVEVSKKTLVASIGGKKWQKVSTNLANWRARR
jgi:hypothetical protein